QEALLALGPDQNLRIRRTKGQIRRLAEADRVDRQTSEYVVAFDGPPERPAEVFVQKEPQRQAQSLAAARCPRRCRSVLTSRLGPAAAWRMISSWHCRT